MANRSPLTYFSDAFSWSIRSIPLAGHPKLLYNIKIIWEPIFILQHDIFRLINPDRYRCLAGAAHLRFSTQSQRIYKAELPLVTQDFVKADRVSQSRFLCFSTHAFESVSILSSFSTQQINITRLVLSEVIAFLPGMITNLFIEICFRFYKLACNEIRIHLKKPQYYQTLYYKLSQTMQDIE